MVLTTSLLIEKKALKKRIQGTQLGFLRAASPAILKSCCYSDVSMSLLRYIATIEGAHFITSATFALVPSFL